MNLVLHRAQVALNINEFDITDQVAEQLNKILPSVQIPPDGVDPATLVKKQVAAGPRANGAPAVQNTPSNGPSAQLPARTGATAPGYAGPGLALTREAGERGSRCRRVPPRAPPSPAIRGSSPSGPHPWPPSPRRRGRGPRRIGGASWR